MSSLSKCPPLGITTRATIIRAVATAALVLCLFAQAVIADPPPLGIASRAVVDRVVDGDTVDVAITFNVRVRLLDCWAPETRGDSREAGEKSKAALQRLIPVGSDVLVHIPTEESTSLAGVLTFGRVLGHIWQADGKRNVSEIMVERGHATREKSQ